MFDFLIHSLTENTHFFIHTFSAHDLCKSKAKALTFETSRLQPGKNDIHNII